MRRAVALSMIAIALGAACSAGEPEPAASPTGTADGAASGEFLSLVQQGFDEGSFKVTFSTTSSGSGGSETTSVITWARRGEEASYSIGTGEEATLVIDPADGSGSIVCSGGGCFRYTGDGAEGLGAALIAPFTAFAEFVEGTEDLPGFSSKGSATIAGRDARCATWDYLAGSTEVCVDVELGIVLMWKGSSPDGSSYTWEVTEFGEPTDADFEPTGPVQDLPGQ